MGISRSTSPFIWTARPSTTSMKIMDLLPLFNEPMIDTFTNAAEYTSTTSRGGKSYGQIKALIVIVSSPVSDKHNNQLSVNQTTSSHGHFLPRTIQTAWNLVEKNDDEYAEMLTLWLEQVRHHSVSVDILYTVPYGLEHLSGHFTPDLFLHWLIRTHSDSSTTFIRASTPMKRSSTIRNSFGWTMNSYCSTLTR